MLVPLYGFLHGDSLGLIVLVHDHQRVAEIVTCLQEAAQVRVAPLHEPVVIHRGVRLDPDQTIADAGIAPLDRIDVVPGAA